MKKLIALLLALTMVLGLAACGGSSKPAETQAPAPAETEAPAPAETEAPVDLKKILQEVDDDETDTEEPETSSEEI